MHCSTAASLFLFPCSSMITPECHRQVDRLDRRTLSLERGERTRKQSCRASKSRNRTQAKKRREQQAAAQVAKEAMFGLRAADEVPIRRPYSRALTYFAHSRRERRILTQTSSLARQGEGMPLLSRLRPSLVLRQCSITVPLSHFSLQAREEPPPPPRQSHGEAVVLGDAVGEMAGYDGDPQAALVARWGQATKEWVGTIADDLRASPSTRRCQSPIPYPLSLYPS